MSEFTWLASPAKLNLFLHINGRFENGYHDLQTYFQLLASGDQVGIKIDDSNQVCMAESLPDVKDEDNLVIKAAKALLPYKSNSLGAQFKIKKNLPMGGGIGGGSSNAATVLLALNKLWQLNLPNSQMMEIGKCIGADVPVFVNGKSGFAEGIGEKITPLDYPQKWYLVANPKVHMSTQTVFTHPDLPRNTKKITPDAFNFESTSNDCQSLVCKLQPKVAKLLHWLVNYAPSRMTGTGASVFAIFDSEDDANDVLRQLPTEFTGFVSRGVSASPLLQQLGLA
ncbi:4-(cytidine 5'-diphospho)-2-C-methyl-D-erythritol kinase [Glaciecola sp. 1036]|uniref:4-(cytidine 5'-diphospho)-2-C-methyl-D-erythritol kinase n=1 Tax=Alteromonadaceae TaxID=72275 RepID=UPI003CFC44B7